MYQSVVVAVDGSDNSLRAAKEALKINARKYTLLSIVSHEDSKDAVLHSEKSSIEQRKSLIQSIIDVYEINDITYDVRIEHGVPKDTIIQIGNTHEYELLVIGTRGLNTFQEMLMGSVSHKVVKEVNIPVMVVK